MSFLRSTVQLVQERNVRVRIPGDDLPPAEEPQPGDITVLLGHTSVVMHAVAIPDSGLIATASDSEPGLLIFALDGDGEPLHVCLGTKEVGRRALAALGGDVLAYGDKENNISTWCASTGARLETCRLDDQEYASAITTMGPGKFVVGTGSGALFFFSHRDGRDLREAGRGNVSHGDGITDIAVRGHAIVTASADKTAAVWSAATRERVAILSGHSYWVQCAAVCARFIATGSNDETVRLYDAGEGHALVRVIKGLHSGSVYHVEFVGESMLISTSRDNTVAFSSLSSGKPVARLNAGFPVLSASITSDARIACVGLDSSAAVFPLPALVTAAAKDHAAIVFPPSQSLTFPDNEPLQTAMVEVLAGSHGAGDACRALVSEENCSRSIEEWASAHRLLMAAVERGEIPGEQHFDGKRFYWFVRLYASSRGLKLGESDWTLVVKCADEAKGAGVISEPEAVLASVQGGQDLLKNVAKLQISGQKILSMLWKVMTRQAESDVEIRKLITKVKSIDRTQKLNAVFGFVFSFVPLGGNALAQGFVGADQVWSLLDSTMSAGVGIQGAVTPLVLDKFVGRAVSMITPAGWTTLAAKDQVVFKEAVETLDISWEEYCDMILNAAAQRGLAAENAIEVGAEVASCGGEIDTDSMANDVDSSYPDIDILSGCTCGKLRTDEQSEASVGVASGLAISNLTVSGSVPDFGVLKAAANDVKALESMKNEALAEVVAAVMINFSGALRPHFDILAECLNNVFHKNAICGDMLVFYPEIEMCEMIVINLAEEKNYGSFRDDATKSFRWRLLRFLSNLRIKS